MAKQSSVTEMADPAASIDVQEAVRKAVSYFHKLLPQLGRNANVMLEEVEESEDGSHWLITIGYDVERALSPAQRNLQSVLSPMPPVVRKYKIFKVDAKTGRILSMKIRSV